MADEKPKNLAQLVRVEAKDYRGRPRGFWTRLDFSYLKIAKEGPVPEHPFASSFGRVGWADDLDRRSGMRIDPRLSKEEAEGIITLHGEKLDLKHEPVRFQEPRKHRRRYIIDNFQDTSIPRSIRGTYLKARWCALDFMDANAGPILEERRTFFRGGFIFAYDRSGKRISRIGRSSSEETISVTFRTQKEDYFLTVISDYGNDRLISQFRVSEGIGYDSENRFSKLDMYLLKLDCTVEHIPVLEYVR